MKTVIVVLTSLLIIMIGLSGCMGLFQKTYTITATAGPGGVIVPAGKVPVLEGSSQTFIMVSDTDYDVKSVLVNGVSIGKVTNYTFQNIFSDQTIHVVFQTYPDVLGLWDVVLIVEGVSNDFIDFYIHTQSKGQLSGDLLVVGEIYGTLSGTVAPNGKINIVYTESWDPLYKIEFSGSVSGDHMLGHYVVKDEGYPVVYGDWYANRK